MLVNTKQQDALFYNSSVRRVIGFVVFSKLRDLTANRLIFRHLTPRQADDLALQGDGVRKPDYPKEHIC